MLSIGWFPIITHKSWVCHQLNAFKLTVVYPCWYSPSTYLFSFLARATFTMLQLEAIHIYIITEEPLQIHCAILSKLINLRLLTRINTKSEIIFELQWKLKLIHKYIRRPEDSRKYLKHLMHVPCVSCVQGLLVITNVQLHPAKWHFLYRLKSC